MNVIHSLRIWIVQLQKTAKIYSKHIKKENKTIKMFLNIGCAD